MLFFFYFHLDPVLKPWQNENLGWIKNPKRDTGKFYNTVLESMYDLHENTVQIRKISVNFFQLSEQDSGRLKRSYIPLAKNWIIS